MEDRFCADDVEVDRDSHVWIRFVDGYEATFDLVPLRAACPCAECRGRRQAGAPAFPRPGGPSTIEVVGAELHGAWALGISWSDGHGTGIYSWEMLREWAEHSEGPPSFVG